MNTAEPVVAFPDSSSVVIYVESDLIWEPQTMIRLARTVAGDPRLVVAPLIFAGKLFY